MQRTISITDSHTPQTAPQRLCTALNTLLESSVIKKAFNISEKLLLRVEVPVTEMEPLLWLAAQPSTTQYFWSDREGHIEMAGIGEAEVLMPHNCGDIENAFSTMRARLSRHFSGLRYYGGLRFQPSTGRSSRWSRFAEYRFIVPRFELLKRKKNTVLACNILWDNQETRESIITRTRQEAQMLIMEEAADWTVQSPTIHDRKDSPNQQDWNILVSKALRTFSAGCKETDGLGKIVLARESTFSAIDAFDPVRLLWALRQKTIRSYEFCFHPVADRAFIGASPERLYRRVNHYLQSEAVAGTRPRGDSEVNDQDYARELIESEKEQREHQFVVQNLLSHLDKLCRHMCPLPQPGIMKLNRIQHLYTPMEGLLHPGTDDVKLLQTLHPTPAVGGTPREVALNWLQENEPFDRGLYAAPVGWVSHDAAEFCVAIRSGLVQGNTLSVYSGAGIVPGSIPEEEWNEIENKISNFLEALHYESN